MMIAIKNFKTHSIIRQGKTLDILFYVLRIFKDFNIQYFFLKKQKHFQTLETEQILLTCKLNINCKYLLRTRLFIRMATVPWVRSLVTVFRARLDPGPWTQKLSRLSPSHIHQRHCCKCPTPRPLMASLNGWAKQMWKVNIQEENKITTFLGVLHFNV